jgi:site-specific recombinase XerD
LATRVLPDLRAQSFRQITIIREQFGDREAEKIVPHEWESWFASHTWAVATRNRYLALVKLTYRLGKENRKITTNPARLLRMKKENNARIRYLNQHDPPKTNDPGLKACSTEEGRLRAVITKRYAEHLPELEIAMQKGLRKSEQYRTEKADVNLERRVLTVPTSKHGEARHVPLNDVAIAAFRKLLARNKGSDFVFVAQRVNETGFTNVWGSIETSSLGAETARFVLRNLYASECHHPWKSEGNQISELRNFGARVTMQLLPSLSIRCANAAVERRPWQDCQNCSGSNQVQPSKSGIIIPVHICFRRTL